MQKIVYAQLALLISSTLCYKQQNPQDRFKLIFQDQDKIIFNQLIQRLKNESQLSLANLIVKVGTQLLNMPYEGKTLDVENEENLIINLREFDCMTFVENCLALTRTLKSQKQDFDTFTEQIQKIRYRHGILNGYTSRLHYFSD